jgi:hypothetical protein
MDKLEYALKTIANCDLCNGKGWNYWSHDEEWDSELCECNTYEIILDDDGDVIWDNGLLSEPELAIFAESEAN